MSTTSADADNIDILDMEFNIGLQIAESYMKKMVLAEDRRVCDKYIRICCNMKNSHQIKVKLHRNRFFNYLLKTMKRTIETQKNTIYLNAVIFCHHLFWNLLSTHFCCSLKTYLSTNRSRTKPSSGAQITDLMYRWKSFLALEFSFTWPALIILILDGPKTDFPASPTFRTYQMHSTICQKFNLRLLYSCL